MKFVAFILLPLVLLTSSVEHKEIRKLYFKAKRGYGQLRLLMDKLEASKANDNVTNYYKAAVSTMLPQYVTAPWKKLRLFNNGKELLERMIKENPNDIEPRFVRLTIQKNAPSFLHYSSDLISDKNFIIKGLVQAKKEKGDNFFISKVVSFLKTLDFCTKEDIQKLNSI